MAVWLVTAMGFGALLALAQASGSALDDPDPARQRPGFLDAGALPQPAPRLAPALARSGRPAVAFFVRPESLDGLCRSLSRDPLAERADVFVVVSGAGQCPEGTTVADPAARLARVYGVHRPRSGGAPVGYAVVDSHGRIRYRTLDPTVADHLDEVRTVVGAVA
ncbi:MAG TPA: hypothetical protein VMZ51_01605 [Acidimicrobiales bacterium]|nr:hypothetical protein [Acidimicrobiales bacterium]